MYTLVSDGELSASVGGWLERTGAAGALDEAVEAEEEAAEADGEPEVVEAADEVEDEEPSPLPPPGDADALLPPPVTRVLPHTPSTLHCPESHTICTDDVSARGGASRAALGTVVQIACACSTGMQRRTV